MILPASTNLSFEHSKDTKYTVYYFSFQALGSCPRALLCFGDDSVQWDNKNQTMAEWPQVKETTPLGTLPILIETNTLTNETIEIPESGAMERYLARKFNLLGVTAREQTLSDIFYAQAVMLHTKFIEKTVWTFEETRKQAIEQFVGTILPTWIKGCEKHLKENGNTGHFVDNKFTLADIKTAVIMDTFLALDSEKVLNPTTAPGLWKLKEAVDTHPKYAAWRKSEAYKNIDKDTQDGMQAVMPFDLAKSHIFS